MTTTRGHTRRAAGGLVAGGASGTYPRTVGLAVLAGIALAFSPVLAAVLAGIVGGLGLAGVVAALRFRP